MKKRTTIIILILTLSIYTLNINVQSTVEENNYRSTSLELTPHDPIEITSDSDFEDFPGTGTVEDPYVIEAYSITTSNDFGIYISSTTKYFIVYNCYVDAWDYGIYIEYVADGTATIINNACNNNHYYGISLYSSSSSAVIYNTCNNNIIYGIYLEDSDFCVVTYNLLRENEDYGVYFWYGSDNNLIHHNTFVDNNLGGTSQAYDRGTNNFWYDSTTQEGNFWSDWSGTDSYSIDGPANSIDLYPLGEPLIVEYPQIVVLTLMLSIIPLFLTRIISKKVKKK